VAAKKPYVWVERAVVISAMRRAFRRYPPYQEVIKRCKREWFQDCKNGNKRRRIDMLCEQCGELGPAKVKKRAHWVVDHTDPVVSVVDGFQGYDVYAKRLYCPIENLKGLCVRCHNEKSKKENAERKRNKQLTNGTAPAMVAEGPNKRKKDKNT